jgi:hypothetical protein
MIKWGFINQPKENYVLLIKGELRVYYSLAELQRKCLVGQPKEDNIYLGFLAQFSPHSSVFGWFGWVMARFSFYIAQPLGLFIHEYFEGVTN